MPVDTIDHVLCEDPLNPFNCEPSYVTEVMQTLTSWKNHKYCGIYREEEERGVKSGALLSNRSY